MLRPFMKTLSKLGIKRDFLNLIKGIYRKPKANVTKCGKILDFPSERRKQQGSPSVPFPCCLKVLQFLAGAVRQEKKQTALSGMMQNGLFTT